MVWPTTKYLNKVTRRDFLRTAGVGTGAFALVPATWPPLLRRGIRSFHFEAVGPLPANGLPAYASLVLRGYVFESDEPSGVLTWTVVPGFPPVADAPPLAELTHVAHVTEVQPGDTIRLRGKVMHAPRALKGNGPMTFDVKISPQTRSAAVDLRGTSFTLGLVGFQRGE